MSYSFDVIVVGSGFEVVGQNFNNGLSANAQGLKPKVG